MEPRIQYAKTADGVSIAFSTLGEGMPLVRIPPAPFSHMEMEWQFPELRNWAQRLAAKRMLVRYDGRGSGLSERTVTDYSLDALILDLEAVVDRAGLETFALFTSFFLGPVAIAYAARHPERVSHLILWCCWARASDLWQTAQAEAMLGLADKDWDLFTETLAHHNFGWSEGEPAHRWAAVIRESVTPEAFREASKAQREWDVTGLLPQVQSPTLVLHRRQIPFPTVDTARGLASRIPDARLVLLEGSSGGAYMGDVEAVLTAIDEFLGEGEEAAAPLPSGTAVILFADIADSTALTERMGDAAFR